MNRPDAVRLGESNNSRHHMQALDMLRGVAAICVVLFHFSSRTNYGGLMHHGYLAVDFFFALSGFVIGRSYHSDIRYGVLDFRSFAIMRLIRLMPLVILGNLIAAFVDLSRTGNFTFHDHLIDIIVVFALGCFLLPTFFRTTLEDTTYPLNGPVWSLFFELIANVIYAVLARLRSFNIYATVICIISLATLIPYSLEVGNIHFGPHLHLFWLAFPRVFFSFFLGVLLSLIKLGDWRLNKWVCALLLVGMIAVPPIKSIYLSGLYDIFAIAVISPLIILAGSSPLPRYNKLLQMIGNLSFPIYCVHYPVVRVTSTIVRYFAFPVSINILLSLIITLVLAGLSLLLLEAYDRPVRKKLSAWLLPFQR